MPGSRTPTLPVLAVFTRDLRMHDNPALTAAVRGGRGVVPLFVLDDALLRGAAATPNRLAFLRGSLLDLHESLRAAGSGLLVRRGDWVGEVIRTARRVGATQIHLAEDVSAFAQRRAARLGEAAAAARLEVVAHPGVTIVPPGEVVPAGQDSYRVFTPYWRAWAAHRWRSVLPKPRSIPDAEVPAPLRDEVSRGPGRLLDKLPTAGRVSDLEPGETAGRRRFATWRRRSLASYGQGRDELAAASTSGLSAYLHFGCLSALDVATSARGHDGGDAFVRQLCWRDFFHQVVAAQPDVIWRGLHPERSPARSNEQYWVAWRDGRTGYPLVDAAMRQLDAEGFVHNRARMVAASFLTHDLGLPWQDGARHYLSKLVDADVVNNNLNWQWVSGVGTGQHRVLSPLRQAERFDPRGDYIRRYLPELAQLAASQLLDPDADHRRRAGYPPPIVPLASPRRVKVPSK